VINVPDESYGEDGETYFVVSRLSLLLRCLRGNKTEIGKVPECSLCTYIWEHLDLNLVEKTCRPDHYVCNIL